MMPPLNTTQASSPVASAFDVSKSVPLLVLAVVLDFSPPLSGTARQSLKKMIN